MLTPPHLSPPAVRVLVDLTGPLPVTGHVTVTVSRHLYKVTGGTVTVDGRDYRLVKAAIRMSLAGGRQSPLTALVALMGHEGLDPAQVTADEVAVRDGLTSWLTDHWADPELRAMVRRVRAAEHAQVPCGCWPFHDCPALVAGLTPGQWDQVLTVTAATGFGYCVAARLLAGMPTGTREVFTVLLAEDMAYEDALLSAPLLA